MFWAACACRKTDGEQSFHLGPTHTGNSACVVFPKKRHDIDLNICIKYFRSIAAVLELFNQQRLSYHSGARNAAYV